MTAVVLLAIAFLMFCIAEILDGIKTELKRIADKR